MYHAASAARRAQHAQSRALALAQQLVERRQVVVALDQRRARADARDQPLVERPDRRGDRRVVRIDQQRSAERRVRACGRRDGSPSPSSPGNASMIGLGANAEVARADVHVVDVEQQAAAGAARELGEEIDLVPVVAVDSAGSATDSRCAIRRPSASCARVDVVGDARKRLARCAETAAGRDGRRRARCDQARCSEMSAGSMRSTSAASRARCAAIGRRVGRERQRDAVQRERMARADRLQPRQARPAGDHVVLGMHLEPQSVRRAGERCVVVLRLQAQPGGEDAWS